VAPQRPAVSWRGAGAEPTEPFASSLRTVEGGCPVGLKIPCPNCGLRPYTEYTFGGELRPLDAAGDREADFRRVYLRENAPGLQRERWFHAYGCRRWLTLRRDTVNNRID
jgi:heterotetrameric sarcosine oxidase delta subunit